MTIDVVVTKAPCPHCGHVDVVRLAAGDTKESVQNLLGRLEDVGIDALKVDRITFQRRA